MARLLMFLLFMALVISSALAVKSCSERTAPASQSTGDGSALVSLSDGSTLMAEHGTVGRELVDWLAAGKAGSHAFELGGQEFHGRTAIPTPESIGRVPRLVAMLRANSDVRINIIGHSDASGNAKADRDLGAARALVLARLLRDGGIAGDRITTDSLGATDPIASNDTAAGRARNQRVSLILTRRE